jgi:Mrp family chromosome partitioning ATPase
MTVVNEETESERNPAPASASSPSLARSREGDVGDGSLVIQDEQGPLHYAAPEITIELRHMVARLQAQEKGGFPARLALTSALSGEGVTYVTRSLAAVLANDLDRQICLVDLNWWGSDSAPSSPVPRTGMAGLVAGDLEVGDVLVQTANPRLWVAPAGQATISERPVLAKSERLATVLDELDARFDHLILDLPAVLKNGEALTLASHSEMCVLVVLHGVTSDSYVRAALADLAELHVLGVILNKAKTAIPERILRLVAPV